MDEPPPKETFNAELDRLAGTIQASLGNHHAIEEIRGHILAVIDPSPLELRLLSDVRLLEERVNTTIADFLTFWDETEQKHDNLYDHVSRMVDKIQVIRLKLDMIERRHPL